MSQKGLAPILIIILIAVVIGGYLIYTNYSNNRNKIAPAQTIQPAPVSSPTPSETANWKTYTDQKQKYTIQYPDNWYVFPNVVGGVVKGYNGTVINSAKKLEPHGEILAEQGQAGIAINVVVTDKLPTETLSEYTKRNKEVFGNMKNLTESSLGNNSALKYLRTKDNPNSGQPIYIVSMGNLVLEINVSVQNDKYKNTIDQILSTFKFVK